MQDIDTYESEVHTTYQAARKLRHCCSVFGARVGYRTLSSFEAGVVFVMALQINDMIIKNALERETFEPTQLFVIMLLVLVSIAVSYTKEQFQAFYNAEDTAKTATGFSHTFYQV